MDNSKLRIEVNTIKAQVQEKLHILGRFHQSAVGAFHDAQVGHGTPHSNWQAMTDATTAASEVLTDINGLNMKLSAYTSIINVVPLNMAVKFEMLDTCQSGMEDVLESAMEAHDVGMKINSKLGEMIDLYQEKGWNWE